MRQKSSSVQGQAILEWFSMYEVVFEFAKSSEACTENTLNEYKRL